MIRRVCADKTKRYSTWKKTQLGPTHWTHDVVATLNQRRWRWFNVATMSCAQWVLLFTFANCKGSYKKQLILFAFATTSNCSIHGVNRSGNQAYSYTVSMPTPWTKQRVISYVENKNLYMTNDGKTCGNADYYLEEVEILPLIRQDGLWGLHQSQPAFYNTVNQASFTQCESKRTTWVYHCLYCCFNRKINIYNQRIRIMCGLCQYWTFSCLTKT